MFLIILLFSVQMYSQKFSRKNLINNNMEWCRQPYDQTGNVTQFTYKTGSPTYNNTSYVFFSDGSFSWDDHPLCGTNDHAVRGKGNWKLEKDILTLDFKKTLTDIPGRRETEKFQLLLLKQDEMLLKILK